MYRIYQKQVGDNKSPERVFHYNFHYNYYIIQRVFHYKFHYNLAYKIVNVIKTKNFLRGFNFKIFYIIKFYLISY